MKNLLFLSTALLLGSCTFSYTEESTSSTKTDTKRVEKDKDEIALGSINMLIDNEDGAKALEQLYKYFPIPTSNEDALHAYAKAYFYLGNIDSALYAVNRAIELDPDFQGYYTTRGYIHHVRGEEGDLKVAHDNYMKAIEVNSYIPQPYINLMELFEQVGDAQGVYNTARAFIDKIQTAQSYTKMADAYLLTNNTDSARIFCEMAIEEDKSYNYAWYKLMVTDFKGGDFAKALESYNTYKEITDEADISYRDGYLIYLELGDIENAVKEGELAVKHRPEDYEMIAALGNLYKNQGSCEEACRVWQSLIDKQIKLAEDLENNLKSCGCLEAGV